MRTLPTELDSFARRLALKFGIPVEEIEIVTDGEIITIRPEIWARLLTLTPDELKNLGVHEIHGRGAK